MIANKLPPTMDRIQKIENIINDSYKVVHTVSIYNNMCKYKNLFDVIAYSPETATAHLENLKAFW
jgi:hypothetical protein